MNIRLLPLFLVLTMFVTACEKKILTPSESMPSLAAMATTDLLREADTAWNQHHFSKSELLYERLLIRTDMAERMRRVVLERYAISAYETGHYMRAIEGLQLWAMHVPSVRKTAEWNEFMGKSYEGLGDEAGFSKHLKSVIDNEDIPWKVRGEAGVKLAESLIEQDKYAQGLSILRETYAHAPGTEAKAAVQNPAFELIGKLSDGDLEEAAKAVVQENQWSFPFNLVRFESARRQALDSKESWASSWQTMRAVVNRGELAETSQLNRVLINMEQEFGLPRLGVAFTLPLSGRFEEIGWKIMRGASIAQRQLARNGISVEIRVINTEDAKWTERLSALPPYFTVTGGPIRTDSISRLKSENLLDAHAHFAFLQGLGDIQEGDEAWRFFGSLNDQTRSLVRLAVGELGITRFAVVYPQEPFGRRMSEIFWKEAEAAGATVTGLESYPPQKPTEWGKSVARLLKVPPKNAAPEVVTTESGEEVLVEATRPEPDFEAVFLPDGWAQAQLLAPQFFFYDEDRLLIMGPELWSQALTRQADVETNYFRMAVCPATWWGGTASPAAADLRQGLESAGQDAPDFWTALGYDFLRFAASMGPLPPNWDADNVNERILRAQNMDFSLAPITWDEDGKASQQMFLFRPSQNGIAPVEPELLKARLANVREQHAERKRRKMEELTGGGSGKALPAPAASDINEY